MRALLAVDLEGQASGALGVLNRCSVGSKLWEKTSTDLVWYIPCDVLNFTIFRFMNKYFVST